ncbi:GNAT family N-acetyltransferase [Pseudooceanicola onchidii]|uniref:GNAT family N-acetyltransferase n=1 Tax=Pseudooceanicola onchidii TaxID=2562279 RepID=UPI0010AB4109|nr:GNAT family N-acetyltransferase [Pseudooceanicola onchidii]
MTALTLAKPDDLDRLLPLVRAFHEEGAIDVTEDDRVAGLTPLLEGSPYGGVWLIGPPRSPIGYIVISFGWAVEFGGMDGFVDELYIRPSVRGRGIGTEVMTNLPKQLSKNGLRAIHLEVSRVAVRTQEAYKRAGFKPRADYMLMTRKL